MYRVLVAAKMMGFLAAVAGQNMVLQVPAALVVRYLVAGLVAVVLVLVEQAVEPRNCTVLHQS
jgi:hypothetical protein